jgi:hypothetical protein
MIIDETPTQEWIQDLNIARWTNIEEEQLIKINLGTKENVQQVKMNCALELVVIDQLIELLKEFKDVFSWTYKDLKCVLPKIVEHRIKLDTIVLLAH